VQTAFPRKNFYIKFSNGPNKPFLSSGFKSCKKEFGEQVGAASASSVNKLVAGSKPNIILIVADGE
jgi:hypothetical protein